mmetsp:Transcript_13317/g.18613  ORF Transcript_13317/g.18613 Transcript_13317/m.18613 type:complete len:103 (-) Transcript_13317:1104-1412(-)
MVLAKSPDFQNEIKSSTPDNISRIHFRFCVENGEVAHKIGKEMMSKNVEANVGGVFIHRNKECELVLEGYEDIRIPIIRLRKPKEKSLHSPQRLLGFTSRSC